MRTALTRALRRTLCLLVLTIGSSTALADVGNESRRVGRMTFYLGIVPAEILQGAESRMHQGPPSGPSQYHVMVAVFDAGTGARIADAVVRARVKGIGPARGQEKILEPMAFAGAMTYGNFFEMSGSGPFRVDLRVRRPGETRALEVRFEHRHP